jgi:Heparinase II/III-like protein/Heparinase II/III N-terminus
MTRPMRWYVERLRRMSPLEVVGRATDEARHTAWSMRQVHPGATVHAPRGVHGLRSFATPVPEGTREHVAEPARAAVVAAADRLLAGEWTVLGTPRPDIVDPDWFLDPVTGRRAPQDRLAFRIDHRDEEVTGNVKSVWELSRHHHLTVLASAWWLTGREEYAEVVDAQLRSWWRQNPHLSGVHWTSGIELGVRLTSWVWVRRLLDEWPKVGDLFETNEDALRQIWWHQRYLSAFPSRGSSANNHAVAEAAGLLAGASAFPWYAESARWRDTGRRRLQGSLAANTFASGVNRELATDYHRFVTELGLVAAAEAEAAGHPVDPTTWTLLAASLDAAAALADAHGRPPRQGDGDEGRALVLDDPDTDAWELMLGLGAAVVGDRPWWPAGRPATGRGVAACAVAALLPDRPQVGVRPTRAPRTFPDAGIHLLRTPPEDGPEIWCRCDGGPHGFLSIAAHAHADALSVEVRYEGTEVLVDPGTYCYHGEPEWRSYFRSTRAHNTIELDGTSQSVEGGPFMWSTHADTRVLEVSDGAPQCWTARHTGYAHLEPTVRHQRTVCLDRGARVLSIDDAVKSEGRHTLRLLLHLGPDVAVDLPADPADATARLSWSGPTGEVVAALHLPHGLAWTAHRGETDPVLGWYSPRFGERVPATTLVGEGEVHGRLELRTTLAFPGRPGVIAR